MVDKVLLSRQRGSILVNSDMWYLAKRNKKWLHRTPLLVSMILIKGGGRDDKKKEVAMQLQYQAMLRLLARKY